MRTARFGLKADVLRGMLGLPEGTTIRRVSQRADSGDVYLLVEHPDLPDVPDGEPSAVAPQFMLHPTLVFINWGVPQPTEGS